MDKNESNAYFNLTDATGKEFVIQQKVLTAFTGVCVMLLNFPVILVIVIRKYRKKQFRNIHILSLSVSDFTVGISYIPMSQDLCLQKISLLLLCLTSSLMHTLLICLDRAWVISRHKPVKQNSEAKLRFWIIIISTWIVSFIYVVFPVSFSESDPNNTQEICDVMTFFKDNGVLMCKCTSIFYFLIIIIIVVTSMWMIFRLTRSSRNQIQPETEIASVSMEIKKSTRRIKVKHEFSFLPNRTTNVRLSAQQRAVRTIIIIVVFTVVCHFPFLIVSTCIGWIDKFNIALLFRRGAIVFSSLNAMLNPVIYAFRVQEIRQPLLRIRDRIKLFLCK